MAGYRRRWLTAAAAGLALLLAAVSLFLPSPDAAPEPAEGEETSYEAVFLRLGVVESHPEVIVVGVNAEGSERLIARLSNAWTDYDLGGGVYLPPMGAVSPGGLLAIPSRHDDGNMYWEIFDLNRPDVGPIVTEIRQQVDQLQSSPYFQLEMRPSVFWGPDEQVAIPWYDRLSTGLDWHLSFVDGRSGAVSTVDVPDDKNLLPIWTADGTGVVLRSGPDGQGSWDIRDPDPRWVLRPDGSVRKEAAEFAVSGCNTRYQSGAEIEVSGGFVQRNPGGSVENLPSPGGVRFACLAPDEMAIAFTIDIGDGREPTSAGNPPSGLIVPGSDTWIEIQGSFAGWLEVGP